MITSLHCLLTYTCNFACDHCFVYGSPHAPGVFTVAQIRTLLEEAARTGTISEVYFEGGEPALYYATLCEGIRIAHTLGFRTGIVTNAYWAISADDAELWLAPLKAAGLTRMETSDDDLHYGTGADTPPKRALAAAERLGLLAGGLPRKLPFSELRDGEEYPRVGGGVKCRGRAADRLLNGLPRIPWEKFSACPFEDLRTPSRVHIDPYGHVHVCQGISIGNAWETPLAQLLANYQPEDHPICAPLIDGGPSALTATYDLGDTQGFVDACHLCFTTRRKLLDRFPHILTPRQVYGE